MALVLRYSNPTSPSNQPPPQSTTSSPAPTGKVSAVPSPPAPITPALSRFLTFLTWLESQPDLSWDYSSLSPFCHLPAFAPKVFYHTGPGTDILYNPIAEVYSYFGLPPKEGYRLFASLPGTTTKEEFITHGRTYVMSNYYHYGNVS